jgi:hypothetical protein
MRFYDPPLRMGARDANAGHLGEWPETPRTMARVPVAGGVNPEEEFGPDRRRVRLTGRDEYGNAYAAEVFLPRGGSGFGSMPSSPRAGDDAALLAQLCNPDPSADCSRLSAFQRLLNSHYNAKN